MRLWRRVRRIVVGVCVAVCVLFLLTLAVVQVSERVMRHRAELLMADLRQVHVNISTWADLQRLMTKWGAVGGYEGTCTEKQCKYNIDLEDWLGHMVRGRGAARYAILPLTPFLGLAHWHMPYLSTQIIVQDGRILSTWTIAEVDVPKGLGPDSSYNEYSLMASIMSKEGHQEGYFPWPLISPHPTFGVGKPSSCMGCLSIRTTYASSIAPQDLDRLLDVNLDCMTSWKRCTVEADIDPYAWRQLEVDTKIRHDMLDRAGGCGLSAEEMAKGSESVVRVLLTTSEESAASDHHWQIYGAKVLETLKGETPWKAGTTISLEAEWLNRRGHILSAAKGTELIIFDPSQDYDSTDVLPMDCGTVLATPDVLARVRFFAGGG